MKVTTRQDILNFALNTVSKAINPNNTLPVLNNILIQAKEDTLTFQATNLEIAITLNVKTTVEKEGAITAPAKLITSYINLLPNEEVVLETTEDLSISVSNNKSQTKIKGLKSDDFPSLPHIKDESVSFSVNAKKLEKAINETVFAASLNTTRPILSGVFISAKDSELILAATDSYRLAERKLQTDIPVEKEVSCIAPSRTMNELSKILSNFNKESVMITISKNQILFEIENIQLISRLIEGAYPEYTKIIPSKAKTLVTVNTIDLSQALKRINLFARELNNSIHLETDSEAKKLIISTDETKVGEAETKLDIEIDGENNKISINSQYLLDVLSIKEGEKIVLEIDEKLSPVKVRPENNTEYVYIIMPLKV